MTKKQPAHMNNYQPHRIAFSNSALMGRIVRVLLFSLALRFFAPSGNAQPAQVLFEGQAVHPTRILAKYTNGRLAQAAVNVTTQLGLRVRDQFALVPGLVVLDVINTAAAGADSARLADQLAGRIGALRQSGLFDYVEPDYIQHADLQPSDAAFSNGSLWGLYNTGQSGGLSGADIDAVQAWDITTGSSNVIVAVIDTGIRYTHVDLAEQMWRNPGEIPGNGIDDDGDGYVDNVFGINAITGGGDPIDDNDHGTHVAGTIGAAANNGQPHVGVAWQVRLMACKFLSASGRGYTSDAIECINFAVSKGAKILNNSWGGGNFSEALLDSIAAARARGVLFVAAAGNDATDTDASPHYPSSYDLDNVISVAALDRNDRLADFSNYGRYSVDLGAPGVAIYSSTRGSDTEYKIFSGTSMACPHVSGVAALLVARYPDITLTELRQRLLTTATRIPSLSGRCTSEGRLNAFNALNMTPDGNLEISVATSTGFPLRAGSPTALYVTVTDLSGVTNATVTGSVVDYTNLVFLNDGSAPDMVSGDSIYSAAFVVPTNRNALTLSLSVSAPNKNSVSTNFTFAILTPPPNDDFVNRIVVPGATNVVTGSNAGATREIGEPNHAGVSGGKSVWWSWTPPVNGRADVDTFGSEYDTTLGVYTGTTVSNLSLIASNDDDGGTRQSHVSFDATAGTAYQIAVDGYQGDSGNIRLSVQIVNPPPNDNFADRINVAGQTNLVTGSNVSATSEPGEPNDANVSGGKSVWWSWTPPFSGRATIGTAGSSYDTTLGVYTGTAVSGLSFVADNDDNGGTLQSQVSFDAIGGIAYQISVDGFRGASGNIRLSVAVPAPPVPLAEALDATNLVWTTSGDALWFGQTNVTHDGADAAQSGSISHKQHSSMQTVVSGPAKLSFWWKVSSEANYDFLRVYVDGEEQASVSGEVDWEQHYLIIPPGIHTLTWTYSKDGSVNSGQDRAWLDEVRVERVPLPLPPPNDNFDSRIILSRQTNVATGSNIAATRELGEPDHAGVPGGKSVWWSWTAPESGRATIDTAGSTFDTTLGVYTGTTVSNLSPVGSNDDSGGTLQSQVSFDATAGTAYQIAVDGFQGDSGSILLRVSIQPTNSAPTMAYVANYGNNTVSVIDPTSLDVLGTIAVGTNPYKVVSTPDGRRVFVANQGSDSVSVIDTASGGVISTIAVGSQPWGMTVSPDSQRLYVINSGSSSMSVIEIQSNSVVATVALRTDPAVLAYHPVRDELWIGYNALGTNLEVRSPSDYSVLASRSSFVSAYASYGIGFTPDGAEVFGVEGCGCCGRFNRLSGTPSDGTIAPIQVGILEDGTGFATSMAIHPVNGKVYLGKAGHCGGTPRVYEFGSARSLVLPSPPRDMAVDASRSRLWVTLANGTVAVVDTASLTNVATVAVGAEPEGIAFAPFTVMEPTIAAQPHSQTVGPGANVTFSVTATGTSPLCYQWRLNGTNIGAATSSSLALSNVQPANAGAYTVVVSNALGSTISSNATLTVDTIANLSFTGFTTNGFGFRMAGPAGVYVLQASTNLVDWITVSTNTAPRGIIDFSDPNVANFERRFYRTRSQ